MYGKLGTTQDHTDISLPTKVPGLEGVHIVEVACGAENTFAISSNNC